MKVMDLFWQGVPTRLWEKELLNDLTDNELEMILKWVFDERLDRLTSGYEARLFLKWLMQRQDWNEVNTEKLYQLYSTYVAYHYSPVLMCKRSYKLDDIYVTLDETVSFISNGTTGLCTWGAALCLSEYLLKYREKVRHARVLELGAGVGLVGHVAAYCEASAVLMTDVDRHVLETLQRNILNNQDIVSCPMEVRRLDWFHPQEESITNMDIILAADVVYDEDLIEPLVNTLFTLLKQNPNAAALFALTLRNRERTFSAFITCLEKYQITVQLETIESLTLFVCTDWTPVALLNLSLS